MIKHLLAGCFLLLLLNSGKVQSQTANPKFRLLVLAENGGHHILFTKAARPWLDRLAADSGFAIDYIQSAKNITADYLSGYKLFIQLDYPPYGWGDTAEAAFKDYISKGKGGWIGLHHATLLGEFDGFGIWQWFSDFMGGIRWKNYIPDFASGKVNVEDAKHPVMKNLPASFIIDQEEWYTYDHSPRSNVHVIANVDESSYQPDRSVKMGDHPVIWTNEKVAARNVYIFMGHSPVLLKNEAFTTLFRNAIMWAAGN